MITYTLSVDEVAMALSQMGEPDIARGLIVAEAGMDISGDNVRGRLIAAGHSLMARGLIDVTADGAVTIDDEFREIMQPLARADYSLRVSRTDGGPESFLTFHVRDGRFYQHEVDREIIHGITVVEHEHDVVRAAGAFLELHAETAETAAAFTIDAALLDELGALATVEAATDRLREAGVPMGAAAAFASDFVSLVWRGSVLRVEYADASEPRGEEGALLLAGEFGSWLMRIGVGAKGQPQLTVTTLDARSLAAEIQRLAAVETGVPA